jgi:hypothetical protein
MNSSLLGTKVRRKVIPETSFGAFTTAEIHVEVFWVVTPYNVAV